MWQAKREVPEAWEGVRVALEVGACGLVSQSVGCVRGLVFFTACLYFLGT